MAGRAEPTQRRLDTGLGYASDVIEVTQAALSDAEDQVRPGFIGLAIRSEEAGVLMVEMWEGEAPRKLNFKAGETISGIIFYRLRRTGTTAAGSFDVYMGRP